MTLEKIKENLKGAKIGDIITVNGFYGFYGDFYLKEFRENENKQKIFAYYNEDDQIPKCIEIYEHWCDYDETYMDENLLKISGFKFAKYNQKRTQSIVVISLEMGEDENLKDYIKRIYAHFGLDIKDNVSKQSAMFILEEIFNKLK